MKIFSSMPLDLSPSTACSTTHFGTVACYGGRKERIGLYVVNLQPNPMLPDAVDYSFKVCEVFLGKFHNLKTSDP